MACGTVLRVEDLSAREIERGGREVECASDPERAYESGLKRCDFRRGTLAVDCGRHTVEQRLGKAGAGPG